MLLLLFQEHLADWNILGLSDYPYIILSILYFLKNRVKMWASNMINKASEESLFVHLAITIVLHCIICFDPTIKTTEIWSEN